MKAFASNRELYEYMRRLASTLQSRGAAVLAARVISASNTAIGLSTEFLGESRLALKEVIESTVCPLSQPERNDLLGAISQLDLALNNNGRGEKGSN
jgi:hypothetical protein